MKNDVEQLLHAALSRLKGSVLPADLSLDSLGIERTRDPANGDFATNIAMRLARAAGMKPRDIAELVDSMAELLATPPAPPRHR